MSKVEREYLTKNQTLVFDTLSDSQEPLSAYTILDQLRDTGLRAPLQVYRALDKLMEIGKVHKLESLNAFVACQHPACQKHDSVIFTICEKCGMVSELADDNLTEKLASLASEKQFSLTKSTIELRGQCSDC